MRPRLKLGGLATLAMVACLCGTPSPAVAIDVSLNLIYANTANPESGGTWEIVAKSGGSGIASLSLWLDGISNPQSTAPRGTVNGGDPAGFSIFDSETFDGHRNTILAQVPNAPASGEDPAAFYGVGTLTNGSPNFGGKPPEHNSIGPFYSTLSGLVNVPWAATPDVFGDAAWDSAAKLLVGTFAEGVTPAFFSGPGKVSNGTIFTATVQNSIAVDSVNAFVRSNLVDGGTDADYNNDGFVNAADYTVWRNLLGQTGTGLAADGVADNVIDRLDYDFWVTHFGETVPGVGSGASSGGTTVPEPTSLCLLMLGIAGGASLARRRRTAC